MNCRDTYHPTGRLQVAVNAGRERRGGLPKRVLGPPEGAFGLGTNLTGDFLMVADGSMMKNKLKHQLLQLEITANPHSGRFQRWPSA